MKYGTRYCRFPAAAASCLNCLANASNCSMAGLCIRRSTSGSAMLRGDLQQAAGVMAGDVADVGRAAERQVHADARGHQRLLHARLPPRRLQQPDQRPMIGGQPRADRRPEAAQPPALLAHFRLRAAHLVHVGGRAAEVADRAREAGLRGHAADFLQDRRLAAALDDAALVQR